MSPEHTSRGTPLERLTEPDESEQLYRELFRRTEQFALLVDAERAVIDASDHATSLASHSRDELIGTRLAELPWFESRQTSRLGRAVDAAAAGDPTQIELELRGSERAVVDATVRRLDVGEQPVLVSGPEITDHRRRTRELERQNDRLDEFASIVSHDIRSPLIVAMGNLTLAGEELDAEGLEVEELETVERSLERVWEIVDDLLTVARKGRRIEQREEVKLAIIANEAWVHVETDEATLQIDSSRTITADKARLMQLFENLFRNAVEHGSTSHADADASADTGRTSSSEPSVADAPEDAVEHSSTSHADADASADTRRTSSSEPSVADAPEDAVEHGSTSPGSQAQEDAVEQDSPGESLTVSVGVTDDGFYVEDDGQGLPDEREQLFEPGYTTSPTGTGFGLAIVESIALAHGWEIRARTGEAGGARFEILT